MKLRNKKYAWQQIEKGIYDVYIVTVTNIISLFLFLSDFYYIILMIIVFVVRFFFF